MLTVNVISLCRVMHTSTTLTKLLPFSCGVHCPTVLNAFAVCVVHCLLNGIAHCDAECPQKAICPCDVIKLFLKYDAAPSRLHVPATARNKRRGCGGM